VIDLRFTPIDKWPQEPTAKRLRGDFNTKGTGMYDGLEYELNQLRARDVTVQGYFTRQQIRNDGWPVSSAAPSAPGIILSFESMHGPMRWVCDTYRDWQSNLRAIALTLKNLRLIDRYGCSKRGEQYRGWTALPPAGAPATTMTVEAACAWMNIRAGSAINPESTVEAYIHAKRAAAKKCHPDAGGTHAEFSDFGDAARVLDLHFKGRAAA